MKQVPEDEHVPDAYAQTLARLIIKATSIKGGSVVFTQGKDGKPKAEFRFSNDNAQ